MSQQDKSTKRFQVVEKGSFGSYVLGYIFSVYLTIAAYLAVYNHLLKNVALTAFIVLLALLQFVIQMIYFLHLDKENGPRWKLLMTGMMIGVVLILVIGTLWIMSNLNYRMTPQQVNTYLNNQQGL